MKRILYLAMFLFGWTVTVNAQSSGVYRAWFKASNGADTIRLSDYTGKQILVVNTASISNSVQQIASLQQLFSQFKDSGLVVIAVPSNSFSNEPGSDAEIRQFLENRFRISFLLAAKSAVSGGDAPIFYQWFASKEQNGVMNGKIRGDFSKVLISTQGEIVGVYGETVDPMSTVIVTAIRSF